MTTFAYPVTQRGGDTNEASFNTRMQTVLRMDTTVGFAQTSTAGAANSITPASFVVPAGSRIDDVRIDVLTAWAGSAALSGTTANVYLGSSLIASGMSLETAGRVAPTFTAAQVSVMASAVTADTTISFVVSVSGSVVPNAGVAGVHIFLV